MLHKHKKSTSSVAFFVLGKVSQDNSLKVVDDVEFSMKPFSNANPRERFY